MTTVLFKVAATYSFLAATSFPPCSTFCFSNYHLVVISLSLLALLHSHWNCHMRFLLEKKTLEI